MNLSFGLPSLADTNIKPAFFQVVTPFTKTNKVSTQKDIIPLPAVAEAVEIPKQTRPVPKHTPLPASKMEKIQKKFDKKPAITDLKKKAKAVKPDLKKSVVKPLPKETKKSIKGKK